MKGIRTEDGKIDLFRSDRFQNPLGRDAATHDSRTRHAGFLSLPGEAGKGVSSAFIDVIEPD